jgi:hypothetical protein
MTGGKMGLRSRVFRCSLSALIGTLIVAGTFTAGADAKKRHKPAKPAHKQSEPKATKQLLANCDSIISVSEMSSLTGLDVSAGQSDVSGQPAIGAEPTAGLCSGNYVVTGTVNGGVSGTVSEFGITIQGQKLTGGPINADAQAAAQYKQDLTVAQTQNPCPGTAVYPTPITGVGTEAFTAGKCSATAPASVIAIDGPVVATMGWVNLTATGAVDAAGAEAVISHDFLAIGL